MRQSTDGHRAPPAPRGGPHHFNPPEPPGPHHFAEHRPPHFDAPPPPPPRHFGHGGLEDLIIIGKQKGRALHDLLLSFESYLAPLPNSTTLIVSNMILISKRIDQLSI